MAESSIDCPIHRHEVVAVVDSEARNRRVWTTFQSLRQTLHTENRDYAEWHRGREEYAAWAIGIQSQSVQFRFDAARAHIAAFLFEPYQRQPHVTLFVCGFLAEIGRFHDDYTIEELERCLQALKKAKPEPFEIKIGGINSFASAPFLEVLDVSGGIENIHDILSGTRSEIRDGEYIPHLTLGLYSSNFETKRVAEKMSSFCIDSPITHLVDEVSLITYSAHKLAGPLTVKYVVGLKNK